MTVDATHCPACAKPRRLAQLMDLYERNYCLVQRLVPELDLPFDTAVSRSDSDLPLHLRVIDRDRYTVTFRLTYEFVDETGKRLQPDLLVRAYRDAGVAEALECSHRPPWQAQEEGDPKAAEFLSGQWRRNLMFSKWLEYLLHHGHGFGMAHRPRVAAAAAA
jgi:uncharacterized protein YqiB (DUF1249 family)